MANDAATRMATRNLAEALAAVQRALAEVEAVENRDFGKPFGEMGLLNQDLRHASGKLRTIAEDIAGYVVTAEGESA